MSAFNLASQTAVLQHVNLRKEGPEDNRVPACDLKFECTASSDVLLAFHPTLRLMLYNKDDGSPRYPRMGAIDWDAEIRNVLLDIYLPWSKKPIELIGVKLKKFVFEPAANWRLGLTFSAQAYLESADGVADQLHRALLEDGLAIDVRLNGDLLADANTEVRAAAKRLHDRARKDGASITITANAGTAEAFSTTLGALTDEILAKVKEAGAAEGRHDDGDLERGMERCWQDLGLSATFVEDNLTELERAFVDEFEKALR